jgi:hypothetical protein
MRNNGQTTLSWMSSGTHLAIFGEYKNERQLTRNHPPGYHYNPAIQKLVPLFF